MVTSYLCDIYLSNRNFEAMIVTTSSFEAGPLNKNEATSLLETIIHNLLSENYESTFSMEKGELIIEQKSKSDNVDIKHNISLLLQFSHFSHLGTFKKNERDFYLMKMRKILKSNESYDKFVISGDEKQNPEELTQALKLAIDYYTQTMDINPFLRGEFHKINTQDPAKFQDECFLLLTTSAFVQDFLQKQAAPLSPWEENSPYKKIKMVRALRVEPFKGEPPLYEYLRKL